MCAQTNEEQRLVPTQISRFYTRNTYSTLEYAEYRTRTPLSRISTILSLDYRCYSFSNNRKDHPTVIYIYIYIARATNIGTGINILECLVDIITGLKFSAKSIVVNKNNDGRNAT